MIPVGFMVLNTGTPYIGDVEICLESRKKDDYRYWDFDSSDPISCSSFEIRNINCPEECQEWFTSNYPELIGKIVNLNQELRDKYSHLLMGNRFNIF